MTLARAYPSSFLVLSICLIAGAAEAAVHLPWTPTPVDEALSDELSRTVDIEQEGYPKPYYAGLRVSDLWAQEYRCSLGGMQFQSAQTRRALTADVRVGSHELDNHTPVPNAGQFSQELPRNADVFALRHEIWQEIDDRYKSAAGDFLRKQAMRVRRGKTEYDTDDMTREAPIVADVSTAAEPSRWPHFPEAEKLCMDLSAAFRGRPGLLGSRVSVSREFVLRRFFDTEGARALYDHALFRVAMEAEDITSDGMRVFASRSFLAREIPADAARAKLDRAAKDMLGDIDDLKTAPSTSPFNAPALVDPSVAASILQAFATRLSGEQQRNPEGAQTFRDKLGKKVLPESVTLEDDPTMIEFHGEPLLGHYAIDDQGVQAQRVVLVDKGVLKGYLLSRYPVVGFDRSNGHGRASDGRGATGRPSNLILTSSIAYPRAKLEELLRRECVKRGRPFGLSIERVRLWRQQDTTGQQQAFRLLPTRVYLVDAKSGKKQLVRDLDMIGTPLDMLDKILALGDDPEVVNSNVEDASGALAVSAIAPTLLLQEVELQRAETKPERPPVLPAPKP